MNKNELALSLLNQTEVAYRIEFIPEDSEQTNYVEWSDESGLMGNYPEDDEIDYTLKNAEIKTITIY
jgi:predicted NUDIX family NTP pyrophosphohydrolase